MDKATQRAIMAADEKRRNERDIADFIALMPRKPANHRKGAMLVRADARAIGAVTALGAPQRTKPREHCNTVLTDCDGNVIYIPGAVKVTRDGEVTYRSGSSFRKAREGTSKRKHTVASKPIEAATLVHSDSKYLNHDYNA